MMTAPRKDVNQTKKYTKLAFTNFAYYTICTMQKQDFLHTMSRTICKKAY
jgi:hypothetical protein